MGYRDNYEHLMASGLYASLVQKGLLVPHEEDPGQPDGPGDATFITLRPQRIPFLSFPYEWCFSQLKDAALLTLRIQRLALRHGMSLKDASAYNVQFLKGNPILIDTLSFERIPEGRPWVAYRQFCRHFLAPLAVMSFCDPRLHQLLQASPEGLPLDLACAMLPGRTRLSPGLAIHLHAHSRFERRYQDAQSSPTMCRKSLRVKDLASLADHLHSTVAGLGYKPLGKFWSSYDPAHSYGQEALQFKGAWVHETLDRLPRGLLWDVGANVGTFSRTAASLGFNVIAFDSDEGAVERNYVSSKAAGQPGLLPLVADLASPSPGTGWEGVEHAALLDRGPADAVMALAVMHHLAIGANVPLGQLAALFRRCGRYLLLEFVPKEDPQVSGMLAFREDCFPEYTQEGVEAAFGEHFMFLRRDPLPGSQRVLYAMEAHGKP
jgi:hypothetical protein